MTDVCNISCLQYSHQCLLHAEAIAVAVVANGADAPTCKCYLRTYGMALADTLQIGTLRKQQALCGIQLSSRSDTPCPGLHVVPHMCSQIAPGGEQKAAVVQTDC
ncbi:TPA: hypothetical protein ACH3X2_012145 [Trebouxia sp. C0005]